MSDLLVVGDTLEAALTALFAAQAGAAVTLVPKPRALALTPVTLEISLPPVEAARLGSFDLQERLRSLPASHPYRFIFPTQGGGTPELNAACRVAARALRSSLAEEGMPYEGEAYDARLAFTEAGTLVGVGMAPADLAVFRPGELPTQVEIVHLPHDASFPAALVASSLEHCLPGLTVKLRTIDLGEVAVCSTPFETASRTPWLEVRRHLGSTGCPLLMAPRQITSDPLPPDVYELLPFHMPSPTSVRLQTALTLALRRAKVQIRDGTPERLAETGKGLSLTLRTAEGVEEVPASLAVLAQGKFAQGGIASRPRLCCPLTGAPIFSEERRESRIDGDRHFARDPLGPHEAFRLGVRVDRQLRPLSIHGEPISSKLFAAGSVIAGVDSIREGTGFALLSAWALAQRLRSAT